MMAAKGGWTTWRSSSQRSSEAKSAYIPHIYSPQQADFDGVGATIKSD